DSTRQFGDATANCGVLPGVGRQQPQRGRPVVPRRHKIAGVGRRLGAGSELFQRVGMNQRRAGRTDQRVGRQLSAAACTVGWGQAGAETGSAPTRYGPRISTMGAPVMRQAWRIPMTMMNPLISPEGKLP